MTVRAARIAALPAAAALLGGAAPAAAYQAGQPADPQLERAAERRFRSAEQFARGGRHAQALRDYEAILDAMPDSRLADDAALRIARHRFEVEGDPVAAEAMVARLLREFPAGDALPGGHLLLGRIAAKSTPPRPADALAEFERALTAAGRADSPWSFPALLGIARVSRDLMEDRAAAAALLAALHETEGALATAAERFAARFLLARTLARLGEADAALHEAASLRADLLRAEREAAPGPEPIGEFDPRRLAEQASDLATLVVRYRRSGGPVWRFAGAVRPPQRLDEPRRVRIADGLLHVLDRDTDELQTFSPTGDFRGALGVDAPWDLTFAGVSGAAGGVAGGGSPLPVIAAGESLVVGGNVLRLRLPGGGGGEPLRRIRAVAAIPKGFWVWDDREKAVLRFARSGLFLGRVPHPRLDEVRRIERHPAGHLVVLEERQGVLAFDEVGERVFHRPAGRGLGEPVDLGFDDLGNLYVLDREGPTLAVHDRSFDPVVTLRGGEWSGNAVRRPVSLAVAPDGGLFVLDEATRTVAVLR